MSPRLLVTVLLALSACGRIGFDPFGGSGGDDVQSDAGTSGDGSDGPTDDATDGAIAGAWTQFLPAPTTTSSLWAVRAYAASDVWVGGTTGTILHYDGAGWTSRPGPTTDEIYMFGGLSPSDVWAVGRLCVVLRWNGTAWAPLTAPNCTNSSMFAIDGVAANDQWIAGTAGALIHWTGAAFTDHGQAANTDFWSIRATSANDVYFVGTRGTILHWTGASFTDESLPQNVILSSIWGTGGEYWIVGAGGVIFHKVGAGGWTQETSPTTTFLYYVHGTSATDVWAVGSAGVVLHYDGTQWSVVSVPTSVTLRAIGSVPGDGLRMVGDSGTMLTHP